jgi:hypothetical protein
MISHISLVHSPMKRSFMKPIWVSEIRYVNTFLKRNAIAEAQICNPHFMKHYIPVKELWLVITISYFLMKIILLLKI